MFETVFLGPDSLEQRIKLNLQEEGESIVIELGAAALF